MELQIRTQLLTKNDCYKSGQKIKPKGIMVHSTGANNPNISRYVPIGKSTNHWDQPGIKKCVHAFIGKRPDGFVGICQTLPFDMKGWHAGAPAKGKTGANNTHIGFECCEDNLQNREYFEEVYEMAAQFCAFLCEKFNFDPLEDGVIISHHEGHMRGIASNHADIDHWLKIYGLTMGNFRNRVANIMKGDEPMSKEDFDHHYASLESQKARAPYSDWAEKEGVPTAIQQTGISDGSRPQSYATREEMFAMLLRMEARLTKKIGGEVI